MACEVVAPSGEPAYIQLAFRPTLVICKPGERERTFRLWEPVKRPHWDQYEELVGDTHTAFRDLPPVPGIPVRYAGSIPEARVQSITDAVESGGLCLEQRLVQQGEVLRVELSDARYMCKCWNFEYLPWAEIAEAKPDASFVAVRNRGLGDVMMAARAVATIKHRYPDTHLTLATDPYYLRLLQGHPDIDRVCAIEDAHRWAPYDGGACLLLYPEATWGGVAREWDKHRIDLFSEPLGLDTADGYDLFYGVEPEDLEQARALLGEPDRLVVLQTDAGDPAREWPRERAQALCDLLGTEGVTVALLGQSARLGAIGGTTVLDLRGRTPDVAILAGVLELADVVVALDSGVLHLARALRKQIVALMAMYHSRLRMDPTDNAIRFDGSLPGHDPQQVSDAVLAQLSVSG